ncbi:hypothetical protein [Tropicibacter alexandrii]|uniref:hypothetical protein n=1 Tax=Tropicibacter alexandrii TaxID=2267683 RepID=UPI000EF47576|nr:hypothetical protein [Tropicibacter alexandrii]
MKHLSASLLVLALLASPVSAQENNSGTSLMEEGAKQFFRGLMDEMDPALKELEGLAREMGPFLNDFVTEMGPALKDLMGKVEDWSVYHPPEILPNGDIIIRRKTEDELADDTADQEPVDL